MCRYWAASVRGAVPDPQQRVRLHQIAIIRF
jgi:hypothetical protein